MKKILFTIILLSLFTINVRALEDLTLNSKASILIDNATGKILYEKNSKEEYPPASMTKIASMLVIMNYIDDGKLSMDDSVEVSANAASMGGSQVYLELGEVYTVKELLKSVAIASANDSVVALAEKVAGSTENFVVLMNSTCKEVGCENTNFVNPHGLDEENHYSSAYDMSLLARELLKHAQILEFTSLYEDYLKRNDGSQTWLVNTNKLLRYYKGVDGLKTGFTSSAGYCITTTSKKNDTRLISVVMGSETSTTRSQDTIKLLDYGFNNFKTFVIKSKNESIGKIDVMHSK